MKTLFDYDSYCKYLHDAVRQNNRGFQSKLAQAAGCSTPFLSNVLNGSAQLTLDHAYGISQFLCHSELEGEYFLKLVASERASSANFRAKLRSDMSVLKRKSTALQSRIKSNIRSGDESFVDYYCDWLPSAIHVVTAIPGYRQVEPIAAALGVSEADVVRALKYLVEVDLVRIVDQEYVRTDRQMHLRRESPLSNTFQSVWQRKTRDFSRTKTDEEFKYTAVFAASKKDIQSIHAKLLDFFDEFQAVVSSSEEEAMSILNLNLCHIVS